MYADPTPHIPTVGASADTTQVGRTSTRVRLKTTLRWPESYGKLARRLVAVASDGSEQATSIGVGVGPDSSAAIFPDLPLSSVKEFRFKVCPYDWVEFKTSHSNRGRRRTCRLSRLTIPGTLRSKVLAVAQTGIDCGI